MGMDLYSTHHVQFLSVFFFLNSIQPRLLREKMREYAGWPPLDLDQGIPHRQTADLCFNVW